MEFLLLLFWIINGERIHGYILRISSDVDEHIHVLLCHIRPQVRLVFRPN